MEPRTRIHAFWPRLSTQSYFLVVGLSWSILFPATVLSQPWIEEPLPVTLYGRSTGADAFTLYQVGHGAARHV